MSKKVTLERKLEFFLKTNRINYTECYIVP